MSKRDAAKNLAKDLGMFTCLAALVAAAASLAWWGMRFLPIVALVLLAACGNAQRNMDAMAANVVSTSHDLDQATFNLFRHLKPSDKDECLSRASFVPIMQTYRRNNVLITCLSAADKRNQGA